VIETGKGKVNDMPEIKIKKRYKSAGDIMPKLLDLGFDYETACDFLNSIKDADVEEVVRCKDCKHFISDICRLDFGLNLCRKDDFCSYGERKE
jgi:hypothetical protein